MDSETNILVRQMIATALFTLGLLWAIMAVAVFSSVVSGSFAKVGPIIFWGVGFLIWLGWGLIAFTNLKRKREIAAWFLSALFHASMLIALLAHIEIPLNFGESVVIPIWCASALAGSLFGFGLTLKNKEERS